VGLLHTMRDEEAAEERVCHVIFCRERMKWAVTASQTEMFVAKR
jgi:hypothetical protein